MKRFLLWQFERGSIQYDVICAIILAFIFLLPLQFNDRPDYMRVSGPDDVWKSIDDEQNTVYIVKTGVLDADPTEAFQVAEDFLKKKFNVDVLQVTSVRPLYDALGRRTACAVWVKEKP